MSGMDTMTFTRQSTIRLQHGFTEQVVSTVHCLESEREPEIHLLRQWYLSMHSFKGTLDGMDTTVITELAEYFEKELDMCSRPTPFVGKNFNVTRAGIHADGLLKNEEIYNIFDTGKFLNRPPLVAVSNTSGLAGIALWINTYYHLPKEKGVDKNSELVKMVKVWVDKQYGEGRVTVLTDNEFVDEIGKCCKKLKIDTLGEIIMGEDNYSLGSRVFHMIRENILSGKYERDEELKEKQYR